MYPTYSGSSIDSRGPPARRWWARATCPRCWGRTALSLPRYECNSLVVPSDFDRLIYRDAALLALTQTALSEDPPADCIAVFRILPYDPLYAETMRLGAGFHLHIFSKSQ